ncbi:MAG: IS66 family insertion sequence element accessory protein TnpB [Methylocella sp.]
MGGRDGLCGQAAPKRRKCLHSEVSYKRLEKGRFLWPSPADGMVGISASQLAYMLDGIDWRNPRHTFRPERAG